MAVEYKFYKLVRVTVPANPETGVGPISWTGRLTADLGDAFEVWSSHTHLRYTVAKESVSEFMYR